MRASRFAFKSAVPDGANWSNLYGLAIDGIRNIGGQLWMAGVYDDGGSHLPLIEHR